MSLRKEEYYDEDEEAKEEELVKVGANRTVKEHVGDIFGES